MHGGEEDACIWFVANVSRGGGVIKHSCSDGNDVADGGGRKMEDLGEDEVEVGGLDPGV